jgi:ribosomal protein S18 acetylase RimI-like enzyme
MPDRMSSSNRVETSFSLFHQTMITVLTLSEDDWASWRAMRLAALIESPDAFGSTLADWTGPGDTEDRWRARLVSVPLNLMARMDHRPIGMASATAPADGEVELISMWVAPEGRARGVGDALVDEVAGWALAHGAQTVALDVRQSNARAVAFYRRTGFSDIGLAPRPDDSYPELRMVRQLRSG